MFQCYGRAQRTGSTGHRVTAIRAHCFRRRIGAGARVGGADYESGYDRGRDLAAALNALTDSIR